MWASCFRSLFLLGVMVESWFVDWSSCFISVTSCSNLLQIFEFNVLWHLYVRHVIIAAGFYPFLKY